MSSFHEVLKACVEMSDSKCVPTLLLVYIVCLGEGWFGVILHLLPGTSTV